MKNHLKRGLFKFQKVNRIFLLFLAIIALVTSSCSKDDAPESPTLPIITVGSVIGTVKEGSSNLAGATVILKQTGQQDKSVTAGTDGVFSFSNVPVGDVSVVVSFPLYVSQTIEATVTAGKTTNVAAVMGGDMTVRTLIPDAKFEEKLIKLGYDVAPIDGSVPTYKINRVKILSLNDSGVADLTGLQDFAALEYFYCSN